MIDVFKNICAEFKDRIALVNSANSLTYQQLDELSTKLHASLSEQLDCFEQSDGVPVLFDNRLNFVVAVLGVLKTGKPYIPIDINYPADRIRAILDDTNNRFFLSDSADVVSEKLADNPENTYQCLDFSNLIAVTSPTAKPLDTKSDIACMMYTSGSTGRPKGVIVTHQGIISRTHQPKYISLSEHDVFLSHSNVAFDASSFEIWGALLNGATLACVDNPLDALDHRVLKAHIDRYGVTVLWQTTSLFNHYITQTIGSLYDKLRYLLIGGEAINKPILEKYLSSNTRQCIVVNGYGPTENTIFSTTHVFHSPRDINSDYPQIALGRPIDNTDIKIVDDDFKLAPTEVIGELLLGGDGLAAGYLNNPTATYDAFIEYDGERYYRSGDLGYYGKDGLIYYVARKDAQVKIHGYRVELEEVKQAISKLPYVQDVIIKAFSEENTFLVAYLIVSEATVTVDRLKQALTQSLPCYMHPKYFVELSAFPRTENQKLAWDALPHPLRAEGLISETHAISISSEGDTEDRLFKIWENVLGHTLFTADSNFFDVGGDSIKIMTLLSELESQFSNSITLLDLYKHPNIAAIMQEVIHVE